MCAECGDEYEQELSSSRSRPPVDGEPREALDPRFAEWEKLRPKAFLTHATQATSQYDAQYRSMASEILALRAALKPFLQMQVDAERLAAFGEATGASPWT